MLVHNMNFNVAGVTFKNEEGKDIQKEIKKTMNEYKKNEYFSEGLYNGYTNKEIKENDLNVSEFEGYDFPAKFVGDEFQGEPCFKVYLKSYDENYIHIGYIPKENLEEAIEWFTKGLNVIGTLKIVGGKYKHCEIVEEDYEEKETIEIEELSYGAEVNLNFCDNLQDIKEEKGETKKKKGEIKYSESDKYFYLKLFFSISCIIFIIFMILKTI